MKNNNQGKLFVVSGFSGAGKGTVLKALFTKRDDLYLSVSATTRKPRNSEIEGVSYHFWSKEQFEENIRNHKMLEYAVYCDHYYGTPLDMVDRKLSEGVDVILEIEVQGASKVKQVRPDAVFIFILPPSIEELQRRLEFRATETPEKIQERLQAVKHEIKMLNNYDYVIINDDAQRAANDLNEIINSTHVS
ncbi:Guanylate kinase [bioreactor metagenome]|uniref:guanylate kinase n=1 Tax=bioreactor metagenome TaxID=1076179 RepID=A0A645BSW0_9ZZZZ